MRKSKRFTALTLVAGLAVMAAACGSDDKTSSDTAAATTAAAASTTAGGASTTAGAGASTPSGGSLDGSNVLACEVTDTGGADDKGFNENAYKGITDAEKEFGSKGELLESKSDADYAPNINQFIQKKCNLIVSAGFLLASATAEAAKANPNVQFAIVDADANDDNGTPNDTADDKNLENVRALTFSSEQPAFLAGYLAAGMSKSGTVGTYGGIKIPAVTSFMNGFLQGVNKYNGVHGTKVKVLGWDGNDGSFVNDFSSVDKGKQITQGFVDEGADIVFPVAGPIGLGTSALAKESGKFRVIGVDVDQYLSNPEQQSVYLTSVIKKIDASVVDTVRNVIQSGKVGADYVGTLANSGMDLAPYHDQAADVPQALTDEITQLKQDIISGKQTVTP